MNHTLIKYFLNRITKLSNVNNQMEKDTDRSNFPKEIDSRLFKRYVGKAWLTLTSISIYLSIYFFVCFFTTT